MPGPNILFILCDQMRPDSLGSATPTINALARRGMRFSNCYSAAPLCQPSRASIVTGKPPTLHGICGNMSDPIGPEERSDTFMNHLQDAGYHTALVGKHHYYDRFNMNMDVLEDDDDIRGYGFDHVWQVVDVYESLHNDDRFTRHLQDEGKLEEWRMRCREDGAEFFRNLDPEDTPDGYICAQTCKYISEFDPDGPLYLNVGFVGPHPPHWAPGKYAEMFEPGQMPEPVGVDDPDAISAAQTRRAQYMGMVAHIDDCVGRLVEALQQRDMLDDTLIIFTADHGDVLGDFGIWDKRLFYEPSVRVPLVMAGPGIEPEPRLAEIVRRELVSTLDLYPTFLAAAGVQNSNCKGRSTLDLRKAGEQPHRLEIFSELGTATMVRDANWKLVHDAEQGGVQHLYNLRTDPDETDNLAGRPEYRHVEADLVDSLLTRLTKLTRYTHAKEQRRVQRVRT